MGKQTHFNVPPPRASAASGANQHQLNGHDSFATSSRRGGKVAVSADKELILRSTIQTLRIAITQQLVNLIKSTALAVARQQPSPNGGI
jgi:hypothetical protein